MKTLNKYMGLVLLIFWISISTNAQQDLVIHYMPSIHQSTYQNVGFRPTSGVNLGLPGISSTYLRLENNFLNPRGLFESTNDGLVFKTEDFIEQANKNNNILGMEFASDIFSFGMAFGNNYASLSVRERSFFRTRIPGSLLTFPFTGNADFDQLENGELDFSGLGIQFMHYREVGFSFQREITSKLSVGARIKRLYGYENIDVKESTFIWRTDDVTYDYTLEGQIEANTSGFAQFFDEDIESDFDNEELDVMAYLFQRKNKGWGIDLGANYTFNDRLSFSAALNDLGYIKWKSYNKNISSNDAQFEYDGVFLSDNVIYAEDDFSDSLDVVIEQIADDLENTFEISDNEDAYSTSLVTRANIGAQYLLYENFNSSGNVSFLAQTEIYKGQFRPAFTLAYNQQFQRWLSASVAYSVMQRDYRNLGLGLSLNMGPIQLYGTVDNLMAGHLTKINFDEEGNDGLVYPSFSHNAHFHVGINLNLGRPAKDKDRDGVPDKRDKCPRIPGDKSLDGCPDMDGDGIRDSEDKCPSIAGVKRFDGCPDTDGDGIQDSEDECPDAAGPKNTQGCPDSDKDGVRDAEDLCPDTPGMISFQGCPDTDKDGIQDSEDQCPEEAGLVQFNGCPDSDEDGIQDSEDLCPNKAGLIEFSGCPDTDGDGIQDSKDYCPTEAGPLENLGCPWADRDEDGIVDPEDACPGIPGPVENQGCPFEDSDGDGVFDLEDACPSTPGLPENNGCPKIEEEEQEVLNTAFENLEFVSGKNEIKESSFESLDRLAQLMEDKEEWKLRIAGHTDDQGSEYSNLELSKKRAQAVADYLESRGVRVERMFIHWYGESQPLESNETEEGRQKNRRVEMEVIFD